MKELRTKESNEQRQAILKKRIAAAQRIVRKHVPTNVSLVDELIAERREEARREAEKHR
jgi:vacuolar-type H+-ATPase subunit H